MYLLKSSIYFSLFLSKFFIFYTSISIIFAMSNSYDCFIDIRINLQNKNPITICQNSLSKITINKYKYIYIYQLINYMYESIRNIFYVLLMYQIIGIQTQISTQFGKQKEMIELILLSKLRIFFTEEQLLLFSYLMELMLKFIYLLFKQYLETLLFHHS